MLRDERMAKHDNWTCRKCVDNSISPPAQPLPDLDASIEDVSSGMKILEKQSLRIMQWNSNGLKSKSDELALRLVKLEIDVALVQETMLSKRDKEAPKIVGYKSIREDRKVEIRGGGLIVYIRDSLPYELVDYRYVKGCEIQTIRIRLGNKKWITLTNFYCPPSNSSGQEISFELNSIPASASSLICGDFNAHNLIWDTIQPEDDRGADVQEWSNLKNLSILNDGSVTRHNPQTSNGSTPDLTICGSVWNDWCTWSVDEEEIGGSDHLPVIITVHTSTKHQPIMGMKPRWRNNGVIWKDFREAVELSLTTANVPASLRHRATRLSDAIIAAATKHVRKVKPGKRTKCWITPKVRSLMKKRNTLRKSIQSKRKEWLQACKEVSIARQEAKREQWVEVVSSAVSEMDERSMWKFVKTLNGTPDTNSPNEVMIVNGERISSTKKKAERFVQHYANVSSLKISRQERRRFHLRLKRTLDRPDQDNDTVPDFTLSELSQAISKMRRKGAPGPDDITPAFLKELGPVALNELLAICNLSLRTSDCPQSWKIATIIPLLKANKPPSDLASYRPVSLTSCVAKVLERMFAERIYFEAETKGWFSNLQAGFRRGRSCADQILRITQAIEDGFQMPKMNRSVLVLLDYSKAFDTVWRERLLLSMADKGVPMPVIRWIHSFLQNRQARVRLHNEMSGKRCLRQGVPQGCVLSPLLFLFFINNLAERLVSEDPDMAAKLILSLFADDVTILARNHSPDVAQEVAQWAVDVVSNWSSEWKLGLNTTKSEVAFFSTYTKEAEHKPTITINGERIPFNPKPKLLGVFLDRQLTFVPHLTEMKKSSSSKMKLIGAVANSKWGWNKEELKKLYFSFVRSKMDYAGPSWQPWLADSNISTLETIQNKALRLITGQLRNSPCEALRYETQIPCYETHLERNCLKSFELAKRLPTEHPRSLALANAIPHKRNNQRRSWYRMGTNLTHIHIPPDADNRQPVTFYTKPPWIGLESVTIKPYLDGITSRHDDASAIRTAAVKVIEEWDGDINIFTDGSAVEGYKNGGSAAVVRMNVDPPRAETIMKRGAEFTSSFEEESEAISSAATWIYDNCDSRSRPLILTDSQSICRSLIGHDPAVDNLRLKLAACTSTICLQWIPGHCGIPGNEEADCAANEARLLRNASRPVSIKGIAPVIKKSIKDRPCRPDEKHIETIYSKYSRVKENVINSRWDQVELARLRSGHHWGLRYFQHKVNPAIPATCPRCGHEEENVKHWLECPGTLAARFSIFGTVEVPLFALTDHPLQCLALARKTLRGVGQLTSQ